MNKKAILGITIGTILILGAIVWNESAKSGAAQLAEDSGELVSRAGLHWHPELKITVKGKEQIIPANVGLGAVHNPIHTHDSSGIIHLEFSGLVREDDLKLSNFFEIWGKDFREFGVSLTMYVNGEKNEEFENYSMKDGDKIELRYE